MRQGSDVIAQLWSLGFDERVGYIRLILCRYFSHQMNTQSRLLLIILVLQICPMWAE